MKFLAKLFKWFLYLILFLIVLLIAAYFAAGFLVKQAVSTIVPPITQTTASVQDVDVSLFSGKIGLKGFQLGNPSGFSDKNIFELKELDVSFDPKSILSEKIVVHSVKIDGVKVNAEANVKTETNVGVLNKNVQSYLGTDKNTKPTEKKTATAPATEEGGKAVVIKDLTISNSSMEAGIAGQSVVVPLPTIQLKNVGENKKQTIADVIALVLNKISVESVTAFATASKDLVKGQVKSLSDGIKGLKDLF